MRLPFSFAGRLPLRRTLHLGLCLLLLAPAAVFPGIAAGAGLTIAVLGDSLTAGYGLPAGDAFPARLEEALRRSGLDATVIDAGVSGDTTAGGRARLDWVLQGDPDLVIVELGGNDALRALDPADTEANLEAILATLRRRKIPTLLTGMRAPRNLGADYVRRFDAIYPRLAKKYAVALYPFFLQGVFGKPESDPGGRPAPQQPGSGGNCPPHSACGAVAGGDAAFRRIPEKLSFLRIGG